MIVKFLDSNNIESSVSTNFVCIDNKNNLVINTNQAMDIFIPLSKVYCIKDEAILDQLQRRIEKLESLHLHTIGYH